jgi:hypothetical protein
MKIDREVYRADMEGTNQFIHDVNLKLEEASNTFVTVENYLEKYIPIQIQS